MERIVLRLMGITGGMGMGKSAATDWLVAQGVPVVDTDLLAREVVEPGQPALEEIRQAFGGHVIGTDGHLDRAALARLVFHDTKALRKLEAITHPRIRSAWQCQAKTWEAAGKALGAVAIPLLFETHAEKEVDATVCLACSTTTQFERLRLRGMTDEQITLRNEAQMPIEKKMAMSTFVIWNEGTLEALYEQLRRVFLPV